MLPSTRVLPILLITANLLAAPQGDINEFFERFTAEWVRANPQLATLTQYFSGPEQDRLDRQLAFEGSQQAKERVDRARRALMELRRFDSTKLSSAQRTSARVLDWQLDAIVKAGPYASHAYIFNQGIGGQPGQIIRFMTDIHPARNARDVENYLARLAQIGPRLDQMITEARSRAARGIVPPRFILTATIDQISRLAAPQPGANVLVEVYGQRIAKSPTISEDDRSKFTATAAKVVVDSILPALRRVSTLLEEQRKTATDEAGISKLPQGLEAYAARLRSSTSTALTPDQVHRTGLEQVARLEKQMDGVLRELGYNEGSLQERYQKALNGHSYPATPNVRDTILADYQGIIRDAERRSEALFDIRPKAPVVVRRIPEYAENNAAANYTLPAPDGSKPGNFNVPLPGPTFPKLGMRSLAHHEAVPGHHFQLALQSEDKDLPRFRSSLVMREGLTAFAEGWGLYAEILALENSWYDGDLPSKLGALNAQLFRARRLVVDTGLHTKHWTRQQAIDYGISVSETERYVVAPGQACAYMIGQLKILEVREKARRELGDKFSLKEFHNVVLRTGAVPLEVLEQVVRDYIQAKK